ncbi:glycosyltransferase [Clostridium perfringens]|nr:glycosyltransferase [Clostridium perfringens]HAT4257869.1 glycosyltransferase [Clostridium perfringens]
MKCCYIPFKVKYNKYVENIKKSIELNGIEVLDIKYVLRNISVFNKTRIFNLNWFESIGKKNSKFYLLDYLSRKWFIIFIKIFNKKIIWTVHNKKPHDIQEDKYVIKIMNLLAEKSDIILIHCDETKEILHNLDVDIKEIEKKIRYIPHPNYIGNYNESKISLRKNFNINKNELVFLFLGQIRPYKNIEKIIKIANENVDKNIKFIITGRVESEKYKNELLNMIKSNNIIIEFKAIQDNEITQYIDLADILIFPYNIESVLNSGSIIMAFSYKKTVISPNIGTLKQFRCDNKYFTYEYKDDFEHEENLRNIINKVYKIHKNDNLALKNMGEYMYEVIKKENSIEEIGRRYKEIYNELLK